MKFVASLQARWAKLSATARKIIAWVAGSAAAVAVVLSSLAAALPAMHVPASDAAAVTAVVTALTGFAAWVKAHHLDKASK